MQPFEQLEKAYGEWLGNPNCVAVSSGTAALHLALESMDIPKRAKVAIPDLTMVACARAVTMADMQPLFVDCGLDLLMDLNMLPPCDVVMAVHVYGRVVNMSDSRLFGKTVIEDLAEAHGVRPHPNTDAACWSFYRNKIVHGEEGGMIAFKNPAHAEKARSLRSLGFTPAHDFHHVPRGVNARMANLLAVPILESFHQMTDNLRIRRQLATAYSHYIPKEWHMPPRTVDWVYDLRIPGMSKREQDVLVAALRHAGIEARHCFKPMTSVEEYRQPRWAIKADTLSHEVIYLPINEYMTENHVQHNCNRLKELWQQIQA